MSHPYISLVTGTERLRAGFGPEHYTAGGHCPINKIFREILTHSLAETMGNLFLLSIKTAPWEPFPCGRRVRLQSRQGVEEVSCGGFPLKSFSCLKAFPCWPLELAHREERLPVRGMERDMEDFPGKRQSSIQRQIIVFMQDRFSPCSFYCFMETSVRQ